MEKAALKAISKDVHKGKAIFSIFPGFMQGMRPLPRKVSRKKL